jgi:hypothetical protein
MEELVFPARRTRSYGIQDRDFNLLKRRALFPML